MKALLVDVLTNGGDCTNNGVTGKARMADRPMVLLTGEGVDGPWDTDDIAKPGASDKLLAAVVLHLVERNVCGRPYLTAYPVIDGEIKRGMAGGNFIFSHDSRFPSPYPVPVHDRFN